MKVLSFVCFMLISTNGFAAKLTFILDKEVPTTVKEEKIETILVSNGLEPMIYVSSINLNCELKTKTIEEAYTIKSNLLANDGAWLQCFGDFKKPMGPNSRYVVTNSYSLGVRTGHK